MPSIRCTAIYTCLRCAEIVTEVVTAPNACKKAYCKPCTREILEESFRRSDIGAVSKIYELISRR